MPKMDKMHVSGMSMPERADKSSPENKDINPNIEELLDDLERLDTKSKPQNKPTLDKQDSEQKTTNSSKKDSDKKAEEQKPPQSLTETETQNIIVLVWILLIIAIIGIVVSSVLRGKGTSNNTVDSKSPQYLANTVAIEEIVSEEDVWESSIVVSKKVQVTNGNVIPLLYGYDENYNREMTIPVTLDEFNSTPSGSTVQINYSRLKIDGVEVAIIKDYKIKKANADGLQPITD